MRDIINHEKILRVLSGGDSIYADIFIEEKKYTRIHLESSRIEKIEKAIDRGVGLRTISPWKTFFASTNSIDTDHLMEISKVLSGFLKKQENGKNIDDFTVLNPNYPFEIDLDAHGVSIDEKIKLVKKVEEWSKSYDTRIKQVRVFYSDSTQEIDVFNSEGVVAKDERKQVILNITLIGEDKGELHTSYESMGGFYGFDFFTEERLAGFVEKAVARLKGLFQAKEAPMGIKTVVLSSEAGGTMVHEAIGHGLEADLAMESLSCYKDMLGEKIASDLITIVDDKTLPHMRGSYAFDDEGVFSERTILVENGVLKNYLFDRFYAMKYGKKSTGNGRRESYRHKPIPRMSNTMILPGKDDPQAIIASVEDGVFVVKMGGGQVDTVRGDFVFEVSEGYLIKNGKIGDMIKNATIMGNGPKILKEIDMVGNDMGFGIGTCGKDGQGVPVSDGQPTLRIPRIVVGGRSYNS